MIQFGFHASAGGNFEKIPLEVEKLGGECFQFFSRNPYGGKVTPLDPLRVAKFKENCQKVGIKNYYIHAPYYINLASLNNKIFYGSLKSLQVDLERAAQLGAKYVITHIGSAKDYRTERTLFSAEKNIKSYPKELTSFAQEKNFSPEAFERVVKGLEKIATDKKKVSLILEIAAGAGAILGVRFEELAFYINRVPAVSGICYDTAHAFASGYDIRSQKKLKKVFTSIDRIIGKNSLKLIHINDSLGDFKSQIDRHAHLGKGKLGKTAFRELVDYFSKKNYNVDMILETPTEEGLLQDVAFLKHCRMGLPKK